MTGRKFSNFIDAFLRNTEALSSPAIFRKWAAISTVAGALERKVWVRARREPLYPNLYVILVGPPGVGKTEVTANVWSLWDAISDGSPQTPWLSASNVTRASLVDDLQDAKRSVIMPNEVPSIMHFNSLLVCANELSSFLSEYANDFMGVLTDIYDGKPYSERRRSVKEGSFKLAAPQLNIIAATTPSYLSNLLPDGAWDQGFTSRTILVFSGETMLNPLFSFDEQDDLKDRKSLEADLAAINKMHGKMTFTEEAADALNRWHLAGGPPKPEHPKLVHYLTRRTAHVLKLCMVASAAESASKTIEVHHFQQALDWLLEAESFMPDIFKSMKSGGDGRAIHDLWYFLYEQYRKGQNKPVPEYLAIAFLQERVPAYAISRILEMMEKAKIIESTLVPKVGKAYIPRPPKAGTGLEP